MSLTILPLNLTIQSLFFKVVVNQAKGTDDEMRLGVGGSGRTPGLSVGPTSHPLCLQPPGVASPCSPA